MTPLTKEEEVVVEREGKKYLLKCRRIRARLKPGMLVKNILSGNEAILMADKENTKELCPCSVYDVKVKRKKAGRWVYALWCVDNLLSVRNSRS